MRPYLFSTVEASPLTAQLSVLAKNSVFKESQLVIQVENKALRPVQRQIMCAIRLMRWLAMTFMVQANVRSFPVQDICARVTFEAALLFQPTMVSPADWNEFMIEDNVDLMTVCFVPKTRHRTDKP